eukprot:403330965
MQNTTNITNKTDSSTILKKRGRPPTKNIQGLSQILPEEAEKAYNVNCIDKLNSEKMSIFYDLDQKLPQKRICIDQMDKMQAQLEKLAKSDNSSSTDANIHTSPSTPSLKSGIHDESSDNQKIASQSACLEEEKKLKSKCQDTQISKRVAKSIKKQNGNRSYCNRKSKLINILEDYDEDQENEDNQNNQSSNNGGQNTKQEIRRTQRHAPPSKLRDFDNLITTEEERMIKLAIKNSMAEIQNSNADLDQIEEMQTYYPSDLEFQNPMIYIEKLVKEGAEKFGVIKIVPPKTFQPSLAFDIFSEKKLPTRYQILQELSQGKPFNQNQAGYTFQEFVKRSQELEINDQNPDYKQIERDYWNFVENQVGPEMKVEYAADLPTQTFGSAFGRHGQKIYDKKAEKQLDHPWNLNNFYKQKDSLLQFPNKKDISGISTPWLYIGMKYSTFCWHFEDLMLYSINYNHWGKPKLWYGVPSFDREKFEKAVKQKVALLFKKDPNILLDIITMISPAYLVKNKVKVYKTLQMPGEFILTFPGAYHSGFSTGLNIGEAVNFVTRSWIPQGLKCQQIYRKSREKIPVFPIDWLIIENIRSLSQIDLEYESLLKLKETYKDILEQELAVRKEMEEIFRQYSLSTSPLEENKNSKATNTTKQRISASSKNEELLNILNNNDSQENRNSQVGGVAPGGKRKFYQMMSNRDQVAEDEHQCQYCTDFTYISMIKCSVHNFSYCLQHQLMCGCPVPSLSIIYRYSTMELIQFYHQIKVACKTSKLLQQQQSVQEDSVLGDFKSVQAQQLQQLCNSTIQAQNSQKGSNSTPTLHTQQDSQKAEVNEAKFEQKLIEETEQTKPKITRKYNSITRKLKKKTNEIEEEKIAIVEPSILISQEQLNCQYLDHEDSLNHPTGIQNVSSVDHEATSMSEFSGTSKLLDPQELMLLKANANSSRFKRKIFIDSAQQI